MIQDAVSKGAKIVIGGCLPQGSGQFYPPTVLTGVTPEMRIWKEEVFGPVTTPRIQISTETDLGHGCRTLQDR